MNYVYLLEASDGTLYTGWTNRLDQRYRTHCQGKGGKYTRAKKRLKLVYVEIFSDKREAMSREWHIKQMSREEKLALIGRRKRSKKKSGYCIRSVKI